MRWISRRDAEMVNQQRSQIYGVKGSLDWLGDYLCLAEEPSQFIISGGQAFERCGPLATYLGRYFGRFPTIILHNNDKDIEEIVVEAWENAGPGKDSPLWIVNDRNKCFEPFYGMSDQQVVAAIRQLAKKLGYTVSPRLERVTRAHIAILNELEVPISLSGFHYLCSFMDMGEFYNNILALPCGESAGRRIWADLGVDTEDQFDLFRSVVFNLSREAVSSGWNDTNSVADINCLEAIRRNATLLVSVNSLSADLLITYLAEEWKGNDRNPFILIFDGLQIWDDQMLEYLNYTNTGCYCSIVSDNIIAAMHGDVDKFLQLAERMSCFILFKHGTGKTAEFLSEVMGRYEHIRIERSYGSSYDAFHFLPRGSHEDIRYSTENRYRVMPEDITRMQPGQAIVFDAATDQIIYFN